MVTSSTNLIMKKAIKEIVGEKNLSFLRRIRQNLALNYHFNYLNFTASLYQKKQLINTRKILSVEINKQTKCFQAEEIKKPHILFITEKWCDCNPNKGITNSEHNFFGSLEASGLATQARFHFDEFYHQHNRPGDVELLAKCIEEKPDIIVLTWVPVPILNPQFETLRLITQKLKIPIVAIWFESVSQSMNMDIAENLLLAIKINIVLDSTTAYLKATNNPDKYIPMWTPQDPRIFNNPSLERDIDISFVGSINRENDTQRRMGINALKLENIVVFQAGGQRENRLLIEEYANIMQRSKISLNFSNVGYDNAGGYTVQCKGRIFEATLCGSMLLESENSETAKWFEPMVDYVSFKDSKDLVEKARYYLEHDSEREAIAARGHRKAMEKYSSEMFWRTIFNTVLNTKNNC